MPTPKHFRQSADESILVLPPPHRRDAIGPAKKATDAIGPVTEVANATNRRDSKNQYKNESFFDFTPS